MSTQVQFQGSLRAFFTWATDLQLLDRDPAKSLKLIKSDSWDTLALTASQFETLLLASEHYIAVKRNSDSPQSAEELRTLFLLMRWSGLRIGDATTLVRSSLRGNHLLLRTIKTGAEYRGTLPDHVRDASLALPVRPDLSSDHFFWSKRCNYRTIVNNWIRSIGLLNKHLAFHDDNGQPVKFRSHMLRDTFAVEMLLAVLP